MALRSQTAAAGVVFAIGVTAGLLVPSSVTDRQAPTAMSDPLALAEIRSESVYYQTADLEPLGQQALDLIDFDWQAALPEWRIQFVPGATSNPAAGYTWSHEQRIEVFVRPNSTPEYLARVVAHELGHAVDVSLNTPEERTQWLRQRNAVDTPWWPASGAADFETGAGDFAEAFAVWLVRDIDFKSTVGSQPSAADLTVLATLAES